VRVVVYCECIRRMSALSVAACQRRTGSTSTGVGARRSIALLRATWCAAMTSDLEARRLTQLLGDALRDGVTDPQWLVSGDLGALVQPIPGAHHQGSDVSVTVHGASAQIADFSVVILDRFGNLSRSRFSRRGHSVVRGLGAAPWAVRVEKFDDRLPQSVMNRWAALAAATNFEHRQYVATSSDAEVVCVVTEDDDGHLIAEFGGDLAPDALIRMRWVRVDEFLEEAECVIVTPLAPSASGGVAGFDFGAIGSHRELRLFPVEIVAIDDVAFEEIYRTCSYTWFGSARRAWDGWLVAHPSADRSKFGPVLNATR
jgi:hypothetical protein